MNEGAFREPLIKLVHFLRAMEFEDPEKRTLLFEEVIEKIGQEPFASPTVFNFYMPDYELPSGQVAPEFQIFDPATAVNLLNGMFSLIDHQGVTECKHGLGVKKDRTTNCELQDSFKLPLSASTALSELDLLLTGGRMTNHTKEAVMQHSKNQNDDVKAVQEASVLTPEFHTLGAPRPLGIRPTESETGGNQAPPRSYKAVVNLYLNGGADSFNLLVPINCALHDEYLAVRGPAALSNNQLLEISSTQACRSFGLHHKFPKLRAMYQAGEAAFVSNIGSLVAPLTKYEYKTGATPTCVGLFSHS
ncbi:Ribulose bisphosphate carboxylase, partial [Durusdinium trenchii]